jgi:hypothetical protein
LHFERAIQRAVLLGARLKDISRAAEDVAIRFVTDEEDGSLQRAARRLGVTDRALQLRRANRRQIDSPQLGTLREETDFEQSTPYVDAAQAEIAAVEMLAEPVTVPNEGVNQSSGTLGATHQRPCIAPSLGPSS